MYRKTRRRAFPDECAKVQERARKASSTAARAAAISAERQAKWKGPRIDRDSIAFRSRRKSSATEEPHTDNESQPWAQLEDNHFRLVASARHRLDSCLMHRVRIIWGGIPWSSPGWDSACVLAASERHRPQWSGSVHRCGRHKWHALQATQGTHKSGMQRALRPLHAASSSVQRGPEHPRIAHSTHATLAAVWIDSRHGEQWGLLPRQ